MMQKELDPSLPTLSNPREVDRHSGMDNNNNRNSSSSSSSSTKITPATRNIFCHNAFNSKPKEGGGRRRTLGRHIQLGHIKPDRAACAGRSREREEGYDYCGVRI